jgi:Mrp family chromosome partitioning ATPase
MGRILEALSQGAAKDAGAGASVVRRAGPAGPDSLIEEQAEAIPFIEVGGPRKIIDASPEVLACLPPQRKPAAAPEAGRSEPGWKSVQFRPLAPDPLPPAAGRFAAELVAFHQPEHPLGEAYRGLLARLTAPLAHGRPQALLFTAPSPRAGTTTVLLNLAITAARHLAGRVLVLDANHRRPDVARRLGLPPAPGLRELLAGSAALHQVIQETGLEQLGALTAGATGEDGAVRLVLEALPLVLRLLREQFALIFVDAPSCEEEAEVASLAAACDAAYLVVEQARAEAPATAELLRRLRQEGRAVGGCILTS